MKIYLDPEGTRLVFQNLEREQSFPYRVELKGDSARVFSLDDSTVHLPFLLSEATDFDGVPWDTTALRSALFKYSGFKTAGGGSSANITNSNNTFTGDTVQDMDEYSLKFINGKQFAFIATVAPPAGEGSFDLKGYGNSASDILHQIKGGTGVARSVLYGDGSSVHSGGKHAFGGAIQPNVRFYVAAPAGLVGFRSDSIDDTAGVFESTNGHALVASSGAGFGGNFTSFGNYAMRGFGYAGIYFKPDNADNGRYSLNILDQSDNPVFQIKNDSRLKSEKLANDPVYADDLAAAIGGVELNELYMNSSGITIRKT